MQIDLRVNFFLRTAVCTVLVALFWGGLVYVYQTREIEKELRAHAKKVNEKLFQSDSDLFRKADPALFEKMIKRSDRGLLDFRIAFLHAYDARGRTIFVYDSGQDASALHQRKESEVEALLNGGREKYSFADLDGRGYLHFLRSVADGQDLLGYFEAIVLVDQELMSRLHKGRIMALVMTTGTTCTLALILYPLVSRSYHRLRQTGSNLLESNLNTIIALGNAVAKRDSDTDMHNFRVTYYCLCLAEHLNMPPDEIRSLLKGAFLHDVGKIGIRDHILLKPDRLTHEEFDLMKTHVELGVEIIKGIPWLADSKDVIRFHHERYDGQGYQSGLAGEEIPLSARVFAVVDVFDALTSTRPYKAAFSCREAIEIVKKEALQFDPRVLLGFVEVAEAIYSEAAPMSRNQVRERLAAGIAPYFNA